MGDALCAELFDGGRLLALRSFEGKGSSVCLRVCDPAFFFGAGCMSLGIVCNLTSFTHLRAISHLYGYFEERRYPNNTAPIDFPYTFLEISSIASYRTTGTRFASAFC